MRARGRVFYLQFLLFYVTTKDRWALFIFLFFIFENPKIVKRCNFRPDFFRRGRLHKSIVSVEAAVYIGKLRVTYPAGAFDLWWRLGCLDPLVVLWFKESWTPLHRPLGFGPPPQIKCPTNNHLIWGEGQGPNPRGPRPKAEQYRKQYQIWQISKPFCSYGLSKINMIYIAFLFW